MDEWGGDVARGLRLPKVARVGVVCVELLRGGIGRGRSDRELSRAAKRWQRGWGGSVWQVSVNCRVVAGVWGAVGCNMWCFGL
jgi:hypothetical protein